MVLGTANALNKLPNFDDLYDPSSRKHLLAGTYPTKAVLKNALSILENTLIKHGVNVLRPNLVPNCNQLFARDLGFVIDDLWIQANIIPHRAEELHGLRSLKQKIPINKQHILPDEVHVEGGDVLVHNDYIFVGVCTREDYSELLTARTNKASVLALQSLFPNKKVKSFELIKSNFVPEQNALHLDCCFQPVGTKYAITCPKGFANPKEYQWLVRFFNHKHIFEVTPFEMSQMMCNVVSISPSIVVSDSSFTRLNHWLRQRGIMVEEIDFREVAKQGGLFRCVTMPLTRIR